MSFTLDIKFVCLCFFVPDAENQKMHVLMPSGCRHDSGMAQLEPHHVSLMFPKVGGRLDASGRVALQTQAGVNEYINLKGYRLVLGEDAERVEGVEDPILTLPDEIPDVKPGAGPFDRSLLQNPPPGMLTSHVVLAAGKVLRVMAPAIWTFNNRTGGIAQSVTWTMTLPGDGLQWSYAPLAGGDPVSLPDVAASAGRVKLEIHHTTADCFPVPRNPVEAREPHVMAEHFRAFSCFFPTRQEFPVPVFVEKDEVLPLSCMTGRTS